MSGLISHIRSRLRDTCEELSQLTTSELESCKWATRRKIFSALLRNSSALQEFHDNIETLVERHNAIVAEEKSKGMARKEDRLDSERNFRTSYMRIVLDALIKLKWPPSQEAFNDPFNSLYSDNDVALNAMAHILDIAYSQDGIKWAKESKGLSSSPVKNELRKQSFGYQVKNRLSSPRVYEEEASIECRQGRVHNNSDIEVKLNNRPHTTNNPFNMEEVRDFSSPLQSASTFNAKSMEVMQHHIEMLSKQLKALQESVSRRDKAEVHLASLLANMTRYAHDIAKHSASSRSSTDYDGCGMVFETEPPIKASNCPSRFSSSSSVKKCVTCGRDTSCDVVNKMNPMTMISNKEHPDWSTICIQIQETERQWNAARLETRKVAFASHCLHPHVSASFFTHKGNVGLGNVNAGEKDLSSPSRVDSCGRMFTHKIFGVTPPLDNRSCNIVFPDGNSDNETCLDLARVHQLQRDLCKFSEKAFAFSSDRMDTPPAPDESGQKSTYKIKALNELLDISAQLMLHVSSLAPVVPLTNSAPFRSSMTGLEELIEITQKLCEAKGVNRQSAAERVRMTQTLRSACERAVAEQITLVRWLRSTQAHLHQWGEYASKFQGVVNNFGKRYRKCFDRTFAHMQEISTMFVTLMSALQNAERSRIKSDAISVEISSTNAPLSNRRNSSDLEKSRKVRKDVKNTSTDPTLKADQDKLTSDLLLSPVEQLARGAYGIEVAALIQAIRLHVPSLDSLNRTLMECNDFLSDSLENEVHTLDGLQSRLLELAFFTNNANAEIGSPSKSF